MALYLGTASKLSDRGPGPATRASAHKRLHTTAGRAVINPQALARTLTEPHHQNYVELAILGLLVAACCRSGASGP